MGKSVWTVTKINLKNLKSAYIITGVTAACLLAHAIVFVILALNGVDSSEQGMVSGGSALWLLPLFAAIFIPAKHFRRIINLGGRRRNYFLGSLTCYALLSWAVSLANLLVYYTFDRFIKAAGYFDPKFFGGIVNLVEVFGWIERGAMVAFLQQFAFLFLLSAFTHTLTAAQDRWFGWAADVGIVAILSVFTPIAPLRSVLAGFFHLILFSTPLAQIAACLVIGVAIYSLSRPIFARKAI